MFKANDYCLKLGFSKQIVNSAVRLVLASNELMATTPRLRPGRFDRHRRQSPALTITRPIADLEYLDQK